MGCVVWDPVGPGGTRWIAVLFYDDDLPRHSTPPRPLQSLRMCGTRVQKTKKRERADLDTCIIYILLLLLK